MGNARVYQFYDIQEGESGRPVYKKRIVGVAVALYRRTFDDWIKGKLAPTPTDECGKMFV
ncbi:5896_t:CDS:2 [Paraglomus brasilianum]|uniref:5896_t:CDS:1 n=1 Tax=Paraglomus brasilianum TaxID=144538 RepID=A0A9N9FNC8_9GLOM|nr:5896_t:CDS:2 [Paraglomus brasilianum]